MTRLNGSDAAHLARSQPAALPVPDCLDLSNGGTGVTDHAAEMYRARGGMDATRAAVQAAVLRGGELAREYVPVGRFPSDRAVYDPATGLLYVVADGCVVTCHRPTQSENRKIPQAIRRLGWSE